MGGAGEEEQPTHCALHAIGGFGVRDVRDHTLPAL